MATDRLLKKDTFGEVRVISAHEGDIILRDAASSSPWARWIARRLLHREAAALAALAELDGIPEMIRYSKDRLERRYLHGAPMQDAKPADTRFFRDARRLLRALHRRGIVHNDLAKEPNIIVRADGRPAFVDFQLAGRFDKRSRLFRVLAYEDLRHLLKHKRTYCAHALTRRERAILARPSALSRLWRATGKRLYLFVTRRLFGWADREGASDRGRRDLQ